MLLNGQITDGIEGYSTECCDCDLSTEESLSIKLRFSSLKKLISLSLGSSVSSINCYVGAFLISLALLANFNVESVYIKFFLAGDIQHIKSVKELPPKESFNILVNLESLKGICFCLSANLLITLVKVNRLLLM